MTKEPIMIDDVDVAECEHIDFDCANCEIFANMCHENPNCYYKQLQKEKIAYKNLLEIHNEDNAESNKEREELLTELKRKEQELEFWKKEGDRTHLLMLEKQDELVKEILKNDQLNAENIKFTLESRKLVAQYSSKLERLKQALQEIKEIAENAEEQCAIPENYFKRNNVSWKQHQLKGLTCKFKQILQKCEVLDAK